MAFKTVRAHPEIIRRRGLGAQQCTECGWVYMDTQIPVSCANGECPTNREPEQHVHDPSRCTWVTGGWHCPTAEDLALEKAASGEGTTKINHQCGWCGELTAHYCKEVGAEVAPHLATYYLTAEEGKAVRAKLLELAGYYWPNSTLAQDIRDLIKLFD